MAKRIKKLHGDQIIWLVILLLALISIVAVYSSSSALAFKNDSSTSAYLFKQSLFVMIGFIFLLVSYIIPLKIYRILTPYILLLAIGCLSYILFKGVVLNLAARWISIGGITFQPSELAKIAVVLYLARVLDLKKYKTFKQYALWILMPLAVVCVLCLYGSVSATIIIGTTSFMILVCSKVKWRFIFITIGIVLMSVVLLFGIHSFTGWFTRLDTFTARIERVFIDDEELAAMTPEEREEYEEKNYQSEQAKEAIQLGGLFGRGPGNSLKKDTLPHPYSDFIFALIVEEMGLFGGLFVILLYIWFFSRCIAIARACKKTDTSITVMGLGFLIILQAFIHIFVNVGIFPVTGQTLPLVSLGGTSYVIMSCAFGIILSVNRTIEIKIEKEKETKRTNE